MDISIIIPALNEAPNLSATLATTHSVSTAEVIVVDGGSADDTVAIAGSFGAHVLMTRSGRARQMNAGATEASGDVLLFLHADTRLPKDFDVYINDALAGPGVIAGAFRLELDGTQRGLRFIEKMANWRSRNLQMPYGDQALFIRTETFHQIGGFPQMALMEDFELMRRLRLHGRIVIAPVPVLSSARRWQKLGVFRATLINQLVIAAYLAGVSPERIARLYNRQHRASLKSPEVLKRKAETSG
ncbi:MAG: TIGR04283 family arsenosugar biosynthesis glycosyltransferase [Acidobacteria bacterium]|nr:TIGR04283 family arsenosugar biosynthesis glycosyltransferase [Acidobacteriota bacterium]